MYATASVRHTVAFRHPNSWKELLFSRFAAPYTATLSAPSSSRFSSQIGKEQAVFTSSTATLSAWLSNSVMRQADSALEHSNPGDSPNVSLEIASDVASDTGAGSAPSTNGASAKTHGLANQNPRNGSEPPGNTRRSSARLTSTPGQHKIDPSTISVDDLVIEHGDAVYRVAYSVTRDASMAEDVSQDALLKAWQALDSFRGDAPLRNWILRITHNTAISALRKRREEPREQSDLPEPAPRNTVEREVANRMAMQAFDKALTKLSPLNRSIILLREVEGLSYDEICKVLDLPMPTVKTRLLRTRRELAVALEGWRP